MRGGVIALSARFQGGSSQQHENRTPFGDGSIVIVDGRPVRIWIYGDLDGDIENNPPPEAQNIDVTGPTQISGTLTWTWEFYSPTGYTEGPVPYSIIRADSDGTNEEVVDSGTVSTGVREVSFVLTAGEVGKIMILEITVTQTAAAPANGNPEATYRSSPTSVVSAAFTPEDLNPVVLLQPSGMSDDGDVHWASDGSAGGELLGTGASKPNYNAGQNRIEFNGSQQLIGDVCGTTSNGQFEIWLHCKLDEIGVALLTLFEKESNRRIQINTLSQVLAAWTNGFTTTATLDTNPHNIRLRADFTQPTRTITVQVDKNVGAGTYAINETLSGFNTASHGTLPGLSIASNISGTAGMKGYFKFFMDVLNHLNTSQEDNQWTWMQANL